MKHEGDGDITCNWNARNNHQKIGKGTEDLEIRELVETIQVIALLRSARILRRNLKT